MSSVHQKSQKKSTSQAEVGFVGFRPLQSNTTYTPNQFFDVCLPHYSRGCIRIVGYMIRRTLGWCDADGNPQESQIKISWRELIDKAKISRGALGPALKEALEGRFIICAREGKKDTKGVTGNAALYQLNWDENTTHYEKDPLKFKGFYAHGQGGNRTDIPNQYFDIVVPGEPLAVTKIVGVIMRYSIGFQNATGSRRQRVALAYSQICLRVNISSRTTVSNALKTAIAKNYIQQLVKGGISISRDEQITSVYGVKWTDGTPTLQPGSSENGPEKIAPPKEPVQKMDQADLPPGSKNGPRKRSKKWTDTDSLNDLEPVQKEDQKGGSESGLNKTKLLKKTLINENLKQQQGAVVGIQESLSLLTEAGFTEDQAAEIAHLPQVTHEIVARQIEWLEARKPSRNRLGLLRRSIEGNWEQPEQSLKEESEPYRFATAFYAELSGSEKSWQEPSQNDLKLGGAFLEELEPSDSPEVVGKRFARLSASNRLEFVSLAGSLRSRGQAFLKSERGRVAKIRAEKKKNEERIRQAQLIEKEKRWNEFVLEKEALIKRTRPADYEAFLQFREKGRREIEDENGEDGVFTRMLLTMFDSPNGVIGDLQRFFESEIPTLAEFERDSQ
ncbi:hypothetical protein V2O64_24865 (plasmid) [Verrucomicrobiaceae bacterium 227]